ncbi:MAG: alpha/beta fold hydrolase [Bacteroidota bacterium]
MNIQQLSFKLVGAGLNAWGLASAKKAGTKAYQLFTTPPKPMIRPKEKAFLDTAEQVELLRGGKEIMEYRWGNPTAPYILLSYGWGYNAGRWRHFVPRLVKAGYRVIAYDPPGHGMAKRERVHFVDNVNIIQAVIEANGQPAGLIAHSFGGACSVQSMDFLPPELHPKRMVIMAAFSDARRSVFTTFRRALGLSDRVYQAFEDKIALEAGKQLRPFQIAPFTASLKHIPALIVHDPLDKVTSGNESLGYHAYWPGSVLYLPLRAKHHLGTPRVTEAILDFALDGTIPQTATVQERPLAPEYELASFYRQ